MEIALAPQLIYIYRATAPYKNQDAALAEIDEVKKTGE